MDEGRWIMQGWIRRLRRNRNITLVKGKGFGDVIGDVAICIEGDFTICIGGDFAICIGGDFAICDCDIASGDCIADGKG